MLIVIDKFNGPFFEQSRCLFLVKWRHLIVAIFFCKWKKEQRFNLIKKEKKNWIYALKLGYALAIENLLKFNIQL